MTRGVEEFQAELAAVTPFYALSVELDHILIPVGDLSSAVAKFEARYGLASVDGGRHAGWGTANRIVPLGQTYLELVAVVDPKEAAHSAFGALG